MQKQEEDDVGSEEPEVPKVIIAELPRPEGPPSEAPYVYRKENSVHAWKIETHATLFLCHNG